MDDQVAQSGAAGGAGLKILMVAPTSFFNDYGGHIRILEETLILQQMGHQVVVVTYYMGHDVEGLDIQRTRPMPWHADYEVGSSRHKIAFDAYLTAKTWQVARRFRPDVMHGHMHEGALIGGVLARVFGVPAVFDYQGSLTGEMVDHHFLNPDGPFFPWIHRLESVICRLPDAILTSSSRAAEDLVGGFGVGPERIHALPDCVDMTRFNPERVDGRSRATLRQTLGIPADRTVVAYLGLLTDYQGIPQVIEAARIVSQERADVHFLIMGYPNVDHYRQMAQAAGIGDRLTFTGKVEYDDAPAYLALGDMAVSAKVSATEGSGKVLNYMAMGQAVVASDTRVHREYLGEWGVYCAPGDAVSLAGGIAALLDNPARAQALGERLRQRAREAFSWQEAGRRIECVYRALLADKG